MTRFTTEVRELIAAIQDGARLERGGLVPVVKTYRDSNGELLGEVHDPGISKLCSATAAVEVIVRSKLNNLTAQLPAFQHDRQLQSDLENSLHAIAVTLSPAPANGAELLYVVDDIIGTAFTDLAAQVVPQLGVAIVEVESYALQHPQEFDGGTNPAEVVWITQTEAARLSGADKSTIAKKINNGVLNAKSVGKKIMVDAGSLVAAMLAGKIKSKGDNGEADAAPPAPPAFIRTFPTDRARKAAEKNGF